MAVDSSDSHSTLSLVSHSSSEAFARPFPPPALQNVPLPYILEQLHTLAVHYWDKPETADCTVVIPIPPPSRLLHPRAPSSCPSDSTQCALSSAPNGGPAGMGHRARNPSIARVTRMTSKLHLDYLLAQSSLFRSLFSGGAPLEHLSAPDCSQHTAVPPHSLPHFLPASQPSHPVVYLPVPHPQSFPHLVHYMYFGTTHILEEALDQNVFRWEDVVRNVEFLGMRARIKVFLGRWYARWRAPGGSSCSRGFAYARDEEDEEFDSDEAEDEYDDEDSSDVDSDMDSEADSDIDFSDEDMDEDSEAPTACTSDENLGCNSRMSPTKKPLRSHRSLGLLGDDDDEEVTRGRTRTRTAPATPARSPRRTRF